VGPYGDVDDSKTKQLLLRTKQQPYFDLCFGKRPKEELYQLGSDLDQVTNAAEHPAFAEVLSGMRTYLDSWLTATGEPRAKEPQTTFWDKAPYSGAKARPAAPAKAKGKAKGK